MLDGRSWVVAEVPQDFDLSHHETQNADSMGGFRHSAGHGIARPNPPAVVTQHSQIDRQFVIINSKVIGTSQPQCFDVNDASIQQPDFCLSYTYGL